jgi:hypothetical protein
VSAEFYMGEHRRVQALKHGGGRQIISLDRDVAEAEAVMLASADSALQLFAKPSRLIQISSGMRRRAHIARASALAVNFVWKSSNKPQRFRSRNNDCPESMRSAMPAQGSRRIARTLSLCSPQRIANWGSKPVTWADVNFGRHQLHV